MATDGPGDAGPLDPWREFIAPLVREIANKLARFGPEFGPIWVESQLGQAAVVEGFAEPTPMVGVSLRNNDPGQVHRRRPHTAGRAA